MEATSASVDEIARVALVARALTSALDVSEIVEIVVHQGMAGLDAEGGAFAFLDERGVLVPAVMVGYPKHAFEAFTPLALDRELPMTVAAREKEPIWVASLGDARARFPALVAGLVTRSQAWAAIPLVIEGVVFGVLGVSFLVPRHFSQSERLFIGALADLCALALRDRRTDGDPAQPRSVDVGDTTSPESLTLPLLDRTTNRVFASTLTLASVMARHDIDDDVSQQLQRVTDELDTVTRDIRTLAIDLVLRDLDALRHPPRPATPIAKPIPPVERRPQAGIDLRRRLCRFDDGQEFAYARGHDFFRASDHVLWAHESDDLLLSARSGVPFARRVGMAFHDIDSNTPLYYERAQ